MMPIAKRRQNKGIETQGAIIGGEVVVLPKLCIDTNSQKSLYLNQ